MSYQKQRLAHDSDTIRASVHDLGRKVELSLRNAVHALLTRDEELAYKTIIGDHPINREKEAIDKECYHFIIRHLPTAGHLRFISSSLRMNILLERMGDYAATIAKESTQLTSALTGTFRAEVEAMAEDAFQMFDRALSAYLDQNEGCARQTMVFAKQVDRDFSVAFDFLTRRKSGEMETTDLFAHLIIISQLERVSDQAKNICEETLFALTGETKKRRPMRILFLEPTNDYYSQIAVAIGRKFFSDRGVFESAGSMSASEIQADVVEFLHEHGMDLNEQSPGDSNYSDDAWASYDVIISLNGSYHDYQRRVPVQTVAFDWWLPEEEESDPLMNAYRFLLVHIEELILTLRGKSLEDN